MCLTAVRQLSAFSFDGAIEPPVEHSRHFNVTQTEQTFRVECFFSCLTVFKKRTFYLCALLIHCFPAASFIFPCFFFFCSRLWFLVLLNFTYCLPNVNWNVNSSNSSLNDWNVDCMRKYSNYPNTYHKLDGILNGGRALLGWYERWEKYLPFFVVVIIVFHGRNFGISSPKWSLMWTHQFHVHNIIFVGDVVVADDRIA